MFSVQSSIVGRRSFKPVVWNLLLQTTFLNVFIFVMQADFLHPVKWFYDWYVYFLWQGSWLYILPLTVVVIGQGSVSTEDYVKIQPFYSTRFSLICQVFSSHNCVIALLHLLIGFLIPWTYASFVGENYERFKYHCLYQDSYCLSEKRLFLVLGGMWVSLMYFIRSHFLGTRYLNFPVVQLPKFVLIKSKLFETIHSSVKWTIMPCGVFLGIYYLNGGVIADCIAHWTKLVIEEERIDTLSGIIDLWLLIYFLTFSSLIVVSMKLMELFYRIYFTERFYFPFSTAHEDVPIITDGLKMTEFPLMQHLAFLDLSLLCEHSKTRREEIFKLSSFGGHPHLWTAIKKSCTDMIEEFTNDLDRIMKPPAPTTIKQEVIKSPLRRNVPDYFVDYKIANSPNLTIPVQLAVPSQSLFSFIKEKISKFPLVVLFFGDRKDMKVRHTLRLCLPVKWACDSLSFLACYSVTEDKYGIVVNDLAKIFQLLLHLKQTIDTLIKRSTQIAAVTNQDLLNITEATALKKSVKRSIYRIVNTFKIYINDLQLPKEIESQLMPYIYYKE